MNWNSVIKTACLILFVALGCAGLYSLGINRKASDQITIEAHFMQYACGDWNDDMRVDKVTMKKYDFLAGTDVDPHIPWSAYGLSDYFWDNKTDTYGMTYRLKGYLSNRPDFGCDGSAPKFWVEEIERLDGTNRKTKYDFY